MALSLLKGFSGLLFKLFRPLISRITRDPDESQRLIPWPGWAYQRFALVAGLPIGAVLVLVSLFSIGGSSIISIAISLGLSTALLAGTVFVGLRTRWLRASIDAPQWLKIVGGVTMVLNVFALGLIAAYVIFILVIALLMILAMILAIWFGRSSGGSSSGDRCPKCLNGTLIRDAMGSGMIMGCTYCDY